MKMAAKTDHDEKGEGSKNPNTAETLENFASSLLKDLNIVNILSTLLKPSPWDDEIDLLIDTLVQGESTVTDADETHNLRTILLQRLVEFRKERRELQSNVEQSARLLIQMAQKTQTNLDVVNAVDDTNQTDAYKATKNLLQSLLQSDKTSNDETGESSSTKKRKRRRSRSRSSSSYSSAESDSSSDDSRRRRRRRNRIRRQRRVSESPTRERSSINKNRRKDSNQREQRGGGPSKFDFGYDYLNNAYNQAYYDPYSLSYHQQPPASMYYPPWPPTQSHFIPPFAEPSATTTDATKSSSTADKYRGGKLPVTPPDGTKLMDVRSLFFNCAKDEKWSKFLVENLESASEDDRQIVFDELFEFDSSIITDKHGANVLLKFFDVGTLEQKELIISRMRNKVFDLAATSYGSRLLMQAFETASLDILLDLSKEFKGSVLTFARNGHATLVVQKIIELIPNTNNLQFMVDECTSDVMYLAFHCHGSRVIEKIVERFTHEQIRPMVEAICQHSMDLILDKTGNYVVQFVLEYGSADLKSMVIKSLSGNVWKFSTNKYGSNVVEKAIRCASAEDRSVLINEILTDYSSSNDVQSPFLIMMTDIYGNYVICTLLDILKTADPMEYTRLMHFIQPHSQTLSKSAYGKKILGKYTEYCRETYPSYQYNSPVIQQLFY